MTTFTTDDKLNAQAQTTEPIQGASGAQYQAVNLTQFNKPLDEIRKDIKAKQPVSALTQAQHNEIKTLIRETLLEVLSELK